MARSSLRGLLHVVGLLLFCYSSSLWSEEVEDGPYLFHHPDGAVEAVWLEGGERKSERFPAGAPIELPRFASLIGPSLGLEPHTPSTGVHPAPKKLLAITDVEGQYARLVQFLSNNEVIDARGRWSFGEGHLVTVGDFVDRGDRVTEVLWLLFRLSREAEAAGGKVHFLLGNHEAMVLGGDTRYIAKKYEKVCKILERPYESLLGADSELGRWLRTRNAIVAVGETVFVHGGISPVLPITRATIDGINDQVRKGLGVAKDALRRKDPETSELVWGRSGPLWYRGYFAREKYGPRPLGSEIDALLRNLGASMIVVGHTKVDQPSFIYEPTRVLALDVSWTRPKKVRGLLLEEGQGKWLDIEGNEEPMIRPAVLKQTTRAATGEPPPWARPCTVPGSAVESR